MKNWLISIIVFLAFGAFLVWLFNPSEKSSLSSRLAENTTSERSEEVNSNSQSVKAVDYTLSTYDGEEISLASVNLEKPVVVQIWATWCHVCEQEFPENNVIAKKYIDQVAFHAVSIGGRDQNPEAIERYVNRKNLDSEAIKFLVDMEGSVSRQYGFYSTPQHLFINRSGEIVHFKPGYMSPVELESQIQLLI